MPETYHLTAPESGTELLYTVGQAHDVEGNRSEVSEQELVGLLSDFWPPCFAAMEKLIEAAE